MFGWLKSVEVPSGEKVNLEGLVTWKVQWLARNGQFAGHTFPTAQFFTTKEDAEKFAVQIKEAFKLVRNTANNEITVMEEKIL